ncbi:OmpA family protein [Saccharibacter sp. 17.LH.SD]|nr:OmpA family protein [Saccharibacter sp. 17.LH.SD]
MRYIALTGCLTVFLTACVKPYNGVSSSGSVLVTQGQMVQTEQQDRVARFRRLAAENNVTSPTVTEMLLPGGSVASIQGPVPVVRVVFPEKAFFSFDSATPLPTSSRILDIIADNMKHDVPDAALTVLGHTDAVGDDAYNIDLSRRRAQAVMDALVARGVPASQLTEVAIGKRQPIAPNDTPEGRALNRRVEFLVSPAMSANLAVVQQVPVTENYLRLTNVDDAHAVTPPSDNASTMDYAMVYGEKPTSGASGVKDGETSLAPMGTLKLSPTSQTFVGANGLEGNRAAMTQAEPVHSVSKAPVPSVHLAPVSGVKLQKLGASNIIY